MLVIWLPQGSQKIQKSYAAKHIGAFYLHKLYASVIIIALEPLNGYKGLASSFLSKAWVNNGLRECTYNGYFNYNLTLGAKITC